MKKILLSTLAFLLGAKAMPKFQLSDPLGDEWAITPENFTEDWDQKFLITSNHMSGFSSGGLTTLNMMKLNPELFLSFGVLGAIVIDYPEVKLADLDNMKPFEGINGKKVFMYTGAKDYEMSGGFLDTVEFIKAGGANVTSQFIHDFNHVLPSNLPANEKFHPEGSCATLPDPETATPPYASAFKNCGYNLASYMLDAMKSDHDVLQERALNHADYGHFHAFNQTPFTNGDPEARMAETGYIYIPHACRNGSYCSTHLFLHGCFQANAWYAETEARRTGLLEYAATNNIIVVFPQNNDMYTFKLEDGSDFDGYYCWSSQDTDDKHHPQTQTLLNIQSALVIGGHEEEAFTSVSGSDLTNLAQTKMLFNRKDMLLEKMDALVEAEFKDLLQN